MIDREDLTFATCYQLTQIIADDWEDRPSAVTDFINILKPIDEPGEIIWGTPLLSDLARLGASETEPEIIQKCRKNVERKIISECLKNIMKYSDGWETPDSDVIKKEIIARISNYEKEIKKDSTPLPLKRDIVL
jgi:hypothetical protein